MASENIRMGTCRAILGGVDLGFTMGGVEVTVATTTHETKVDQLGDAVAAEVIMGRTITVKAPLVETSVANMTSVMPGATLLTVGGAFTLGKITVATNPADGDTVTVSGKVFTFRTAVSLAGDVLIGANAGATASNLRDALAASSDVVLSRFDWTVLASVVTGTAKSKGTVLNGTPLVAGQVSITLQAFAGGVEPTSSSVTVTTATGISLLAQAKELRLHPIAKPLNDTSEDLVIPLAACAGGMNFAYKYDAERVFDCEFKGYPDPVTSVLFTYGGSAA